MPSFTFVSTANAVVLRGGVPVFVDVREDTCNIDEAQVEAAVTERTKATARRPLRRRRLRDGRRSADVADAPWARAHRGRRARCRRTLARPAAGRHRPPRRAQLPRDQERQVRRGRRAARQRRALRRAGRDPPGEGHRPPALLPRRGRQVHVAGRRLVVPAQRPRRGVPLGAARADRRDQRRPAARPGTRYHAAFEELERDGSSAAAGHPGRLRATTRTCTTCSSRHAAERDGTRAMRSRARSIYAAFHYVPLHASPAGLALRPRRRRPTGDPAVSDRLVRMPLWSGIPPDGRRAGRRVGPRVLRRRLTHSALAEPRA